MVTSTCGVRALAAEPLAFSEPCQPPWPAQTAARERQATLLSKDSTREASERVALTPSWVTSQPIVRFSHLLSSGH